LSRSRRILRFIVRGLLGLFLVLVVVLAGAYAFTFTDRFRELARTQALALLASSFRGQVNVERLDGSVWGDLLLRNVRLRYADVDVVQVPQVRLRYSLLSLVHGRLEIAAIEVSSPVVDMRGDDKGNWNLTAALSSPNPTPPASGGGFPISIATLRIDDGKVSVTPCRGTSTCRLDGVTLDAKLGIEAAGIDADVRRIAVRAAVEGLPPASLESSLRYSARPPARAEVRDLVLATPSSRVQLRGTVDRPDDLKAIRTDAVLTIVALAPQDVALLAPQTTLDQPITGTVKASGPANDLHAEVELAAGDARLRGNANADVAAAPPAGRGAVELHALDLAKVAGNLGARGVVDANVEGSLRGTELAAAHLDGRLAMRGAAYQQWQLGDLATELKLADGRGSFDGALQGASGKVTWKGYADLAGEQRFAADVAVLHFDPKKLVAGSSPGDLNVRASAEGSGFALERQKSHVVVTVDRSRLDRVIVDRGRADLRIADAQLRIGELSLDAQNAAVRASGVVGLAKNARGEAKLQVKVGDVAPWLALADTQGSGSLTLDGNVRGALGDIATDGTLTATALGVGANSVRQSTIRFDVRGVGGATPSGRVDASASGIHSAVDLDDVNAQVVLSSPKARDAAAQQIFADTVLRAQDVVGRHHQSKMRIAYGTAGIDVAVSELHLEPPQGRFDLAQPARISWRKRVLGIENLRLVGEGHSFAASGTVSPTGPQRLEVTADRVPLDWVKSFNREAPDMTGLLAARLNLTGTAAAPQLAATVNVTELKVAGQPYAGLRASLDYRAQAAALDARFDQDTEHFLTATGRLPLELRWDPQFVTRIAGDVDFTARSNGLSLAFVNALAPRTLQKVTGDIVVDVSAHGPIDRPAPHGMIGLRDGGATIPPLGVAIGAATVQVDIAPDVIRISKMQAVGNDGRLDGGGTIALAGYAPDRLDLRLTLDRWPAIATYRYRSDVSGEIRCGGTAAAPIVNGKMEVLWAIIRPDLDFLTKAPTKRDPTIQVVTTTPAQAEAKAATAPPETTAPSAPQSSVYDNLTADLTVVIHRNTWINHADAAAELQGQVRARKVPQEDLRLSGTIETVRGWMVFQGKRFTLDHGQINFTGSKEIDPGLDITANYKAGQYTVMVIIGGTANKPSLKLDSDPALSQADILSVLVFGKPTNELNDGQRQSMRNRAQDLATSFAVSEVGRSVGEALGLAGHGIQVQEVSTERVALGTYLTERTYVTIAENVAKQGQEVGIEYELTRHWGVSTSTTSAGGSGADVVWRVRY
jgi:translocation and assembly module TamB